MHLGEGFFHLCSNHWVEYESNSLNRTEDVEVDAALASWKEVQMQKSINRIVLMIARLKLII